MSKNKENQYHHKDLKEKLISEGLALLNEIGYAKFSIRQVAIRCKVSHNAPYRHFRNKEELIGAIEEKAIKEFHTVLSCAVEQHPEPLEQIRGIGINYVDFFCNNPEYLNLFFSNEQKVKILIENDRFSSNDAYLFAIFHKCFKNYFKSVNNPSGLKPAVILQFWSTVHGLTTLIVNNKLIFTDGYKRYTAEIMERLIESMKK